MSGTLRRTASTLLGVALIAVAAVVPATPASAATTYFHLKLFGNGRCMAIGSSSVANGARAILWPCQDGLADQTWYQDIHTGDDYGLLINRNSGKCLTVNGASTTAGAQLTQWDCASNRPGEQLWAMDLHNTDDRYILKNHKSRLVAAIFSSGGANGTVVIQRSETSSDSLETWQK
jgi:hypothetical protein